MPSNHFILCHPFLILPSVFPRIRVFSSESTLYIRWPKYWSFSVSPSNEYSGLISFRIDWFDFPAVERTLKSFLQHHSLKASVLQCSALFVVQNYPYMTTAKTIALTRWTLVGKVRSLLFNMLSAKSLQSCPILCDPMNRSTPGLPVSHKLQDFTETQVHWVSDAIQPSHPLLSPSPPALNLSQHQGLFQWVNPLHEVAKVLEFQL